jgi:hypothetical protein
VRHLVRAGIEFIVASLNKIKTPIILIIDNFDSLCPLFPLARGKLRSAYELHNSSVIIYFLDLISGLIFMFQNNKILIQNEEKELESIRYNRQQTRGLESLVITTL